MASSTDSFQDSVKNVSTDGQELQPKVNPLTTALLDRLRQELSDESAKTIFACGGSIPIAKSENSSEMEQSQSLATTEPITIRWDPAVAGVFAEHAKLVLPLESETQDNLERLINNTKPATFGFQGKDTYDETYRKALKMDTTAFATTFDPYSLGIIDTIAQALLPTIPETDVPRVVKAELYKLNVYSGPSGKFKAHVDTPRSNGQFGSLVVCLPLEHKGGQLVVRHSGRELTFDWGSSTHAVSWAAFYSDCEHEVLEVTSGHRVTLTFNLYALRGNGTLAGVPSPILDITQLPMYKSLESIYKDQNFLPDGGHIGFYCNHAYPHTTSEAVILPDLLKGLDMMLLEAFRRLKVKAEVKPVLEWGSRKRMVIGSKTGEYLGHLGSMRNEYEDEVKELIDDWRMGETLDWNQVHWVSVPCHKQLQMTYIVYGNEESLEALYSYCAIIAELPPYDERLS